MYNLLEELKNTERYYFIISNGHPYVEFSDDDNIVKFRIFPDLTDAQAYSFDLIEQDFIRRSLTKVNFTSPEEVWTKVIPFVIKEMNELFEEDVAVEVLACKIVDDVVMEECLFNSKETIN